MQFLSTQSFVKLPKHCRQLHLQQRNELNIKLPKKNTLCNKSAFIFLECNIKWMTENKTNCGQVSNNVPECTK